jgi:cell division transport system permease protein
MRLQFVLSEIGIGLRRNISMTVSVVLVTMISLLLLGMALLASAQVSTMKGFWYDKVEVSIFLCPSDSPYPSCADGEVTQAQRDEIEAQLNSLKPLVQKVFFESKQEAYEHFKEQFKDSAILNNVTPEQMPESFRVKLSDPERFDVVASAFRGAPGVEQVPDTRKLLDNLFAVLGAVTWVARGLAVVMAVTAVLLIATTVRLSAFSRRREIGIMRLVGAPSWLIQLPFLMEAVLATVVGTLLATGLLFLGVRSGITGFLAPRVRSLQFITVDDLWSIAPLLLAAGVLLAMLSSVVTMRRYLRV